MNFRLVNGATNSPKSAYLSRTESTLRFVTIWTLTRAVETQFGIWKIYQDKHPGIHDG
jgi:hypothetical protein